MVVELGPYPLCEACKKVNGGLVSVQHRQVHLRAHGKQACVDRRLARLITRLWAVCDTRSCCEDDDGYAYVVPTMDTRQAAEDLLTALGIRYSLDQGILFFSLAEARRATRRRLWRRNRP